MKTFILALIMAFSFNIFVSADMMEGDFTGTITISRGNIKSIKWTKEELVIELERESEDITIEWGEELIMDTLPFKPIPTLK